MLCEAYLKEEFSCIYTRFLLRQVRQTRFFTVKVATCSREPVGIREPILQIAAIKMASKMAARAFSRCNKAQWGQLQIDTLSSDWKNFHCMCCPCVWQQKCAFSWDLLAPVQYNHQYILGWPPLRITEKGSSETQEHRQAVQACVEQLYYCTYFYKN